MGSQTIGSDRRSKKASISCKIGEVAHRYLIIRFAICVEVVFTQLHIGLRSASFFCSRHFTYLSSTLSSTPFYDKISDDYYL